jgi:hypothetical protein
MDLITFGSEVKPTLNKPMRLPELHDKLIIADRKINDLNTIKSKIESQLHGLKAKTIIVDNVITFKTISGIMPSGFGYKSSNLTLLRIYKDGSIVIEKHKNSLQFKWTVSLDNLFFLAFFSSIIAGVVTYFTTSVESIFVVATSFGYFLIFVFLGILFIKYKLNDLIESSVYRNSN